MDEIIEQLFFIKTHSEPFLHKTPNEKEKIALEKFDDSLTTEQRIMFREYETLLYSRLDKLALEFFQCGFETGQNAEIELLKISLKRF